MISKVTWGQCWFLRPGFFKQLGNRNFKVNCRSNLCCIFKEVSSLFKYFQDFSLCVNVSYNYFMLSLNDFPRTINEFYCFYQVVVVFIPVSSSSSFSHFLRVPVVVSCCKFLKFIILKICYEIDLTFLSVEIKINILFVNINFTGNFFF